MRDLHDRSDDTFAAAVAAGVPVHAGTDAGGYVEHGRIADEVIALRRIGLAPREVLYAATEQARNWLGLGARDVGDAGDLLVYPADPAVDPQVLRAPTAIIRAGRIIGGESERLGFGGTGRRGRISRSRLSPGPSLQAAAAIGANRTR